MRPCDICIDPQCKGKRNCHCETCSKTDRCPRYLGVKPTIRITRKCTQACTHCLSECSPKCTEVMSLETARHISTFCKSNNIRRAEVMGGEFFCHPQWQEILDVVGAGLDQIRLVTNGDWADDKKLAAQVISFLLQHDQYYVAISKDQWHSNRHVQAAADQLREADIIHIMADNVLKPDGLIPLGRARFEFGFYSMFNAYCCHPDVKYNLLIDERGEIFRCPGGSMFRYACVQDHQGGGFAETFKKFNTTFLRHTMTCSFCHRAERDMKAGKPGHWASKECT